jgi:uncharacterized protein (TIGR03083 family)
MTSMYGFAYKAGHDRVVAFLADKDTDTIVPACPDWSAADVVRHLAGISADTTNLVFEGFASDEWTEAQVGARRSMTYDEVVDEWATSIDTAVAVIDDVDSLDLPDLIPTAFGPIPVSVVPGAAVSDILHHEYDIRNAFGDKGSRDLMELQVAAAAHVRGLRQKFTLLGLPTLRVVSTDAGQEWNIGRDEPVATVKTSSFELFRGIGGRRTRDEILAWDWDGDAETFVDAMHYDHFRMRSESLGE